MARMIVVLLGISVLPSSSSAQEGDEDVEVEVDDVVDAQPAQESAQEVEARTRFELGQQLYEQGRFEDALEQFRAAHELSGRAGLLYNIYLCHRDAGANREAATSLRGYLAAEPDAANRAMLERRLTSLDEQIAREDDAARRASDAEQRAARVRDRNFTAPLVTLISGAVVLATAGSLGLANRSLHDDIMGRCYDGELCLSEERGDIESLDRRNLTADVLAGIGGAVTLAGLIWLVIEGTTGGADGDATSVACGVGGCAVRGRF